MIARNRPPRPRELVVPFTGTATPEQAKRRQENIERANGKFRKGFWQMARALYKFYAVQAFRQFGYKAMSNYLDDGNAPVGRAWGMFMISAYYQYRVTLPKILPSREAVELSTMLGQIKSENLQAIQPQVNRLMARAAGRPLPSDTKALDPITPYAAAQQVFTLVEVAHHAATGSSAKREGDPDPPIKASFKFRVGELPPAVLDWWAAHELPTDNLGLIFYGVAVQDKDDTNGQ